MQPVTTNHHFLEILAPLPVSKEPSEHDKIATFETQENRYKNDRTESNFISFLSFLFYAREFERLKKALDEYSSDFETLSFIFTAHYLHYQGKIIESAVLLEKYLSVYGNSSEGLFLAASLQFEYKSQLCFSMNHALIALLHFFTGRYDLGVESYDRIQPNISLHWIRVLMQAATSGFNGELNATITKCAMPRCAIIALLVMGKKSDQLENLAESKLDLFPYDFGLRDALMGYYLRVHNLNQASLHYDLYVKGAAPYGDDFFVRAKYFLMKGDLAEAQRIIDEHHPSSLVCFVRMLNLYKQIPSALDNHRNILIEGVKKFPKSLFLLREYADLLSEEDREVECDEVLDRILKINPKDQQSLLMKASSATTFKAAKQYLTRIEKEYPSCSSTLSIGVAVRYEFGQEMNRALHDIEILRAKGDDLISEKLYVDILIYLERYDDVLKASATCGEKFNLIYLFREIICFLRKNEIDLAEKLISVYETTKGPLGEQERWIKGEILVSQKRYEEAYPYFSGIKPKCVHLNHRTLKACFKCLKELNQEDEARKIYDQIPESSRGFYGEYVEWLNSLSKRAVNRARPVRRAADIAQSAFPVLEKKEKKKKVEDYVKPSPHSITLKKGAFSAAATEGVNPLYRKSPKIAAEDLVRKCLIEPYPAEFAQDLDGAIKSLNTIHACLLQPFPLIAEIEFHIVNYLSKLHSHPNAPSIISSRVMNFESIRHSFKLMWEYPHLITPKVVRLFAEDSNRLANALQESKKRYANIHELSAYPIENPSIFEEYDRDKKIKILLTFIKAKLNFLINCKFNFIDFDDDRETKVIMLQIWYIRAAIRSMYRYDIDKANQLRNLFPEFLKEFKNLCYDQSELDGVNFEMAAFIYLSAKSRMEAIDKIK